MSEKISDFGRVFMNIAGELASNITERVLKEITKREPFVFIESVSSEDLQFLEFRKEVVVNGDYGISSEEGSVLALYDKINEESPLEFKEVMVFFSQGNTRLLVTVDKTDPIAPEYPRVTVYPIKHVIILSRESGLTELVGQGTKIEKENMGFEGGEEALSLLYRLRDLYLQRKDSMHISFHDDEEKQVVYSVLIDESKRVKYLVHAGDSFVSVDESELFVKNDDSDVVRINDKEFYVIHD